MQAYSVTSQTPVYDDAMRTGRPTTRGRTEFGKRLLAAREDLGLSQAEVAGQVGITQSRYADWERHPVGLRPEQVLKLCDVLKVPVEYLYGQKNKRNGRGGPPGRLRQVFDQVAELPRQQQRKVIEFVEAFVEKKTAGS